MIVVLATCMALFMMGCPPPSTSGYEDSFRMVTFNVQFLPGSDDDETRSVRIADRILAADYDIIVLNEVFDEEARDKFVEKLQATYPSFVAYIGSSEIGEDSGLMLFSKFPFEPLPNPVHRHDPGHLRATNAGAAWGDVAFIEYHSCVFPDNWAAKGAAFVRIKNPNTDHIYNVAFTHTQASYQESEHDQADWLKPIWARTDQLEVLQGVITESLLAGQFQREDTFVLGDLNIDGDLADPNLGLDGYARPNLFEWVARLNTVGAFFSDYFDDTWGFEQPRQDRGLSNLYVWGPDYSPDQGGRLDYILKDKNTGDSTIKKVVIQHLTQAHNMRDGAPFVESGMGMAGVNELSDHIGVNADINLWAPHCRPLEAAVPPMDLEFTGTITYPGSMQWYRVDQAGTYAFVITGAGMEYRVYEAKDMSTPASQYFGETTTFTDAHGKSHVGQKFHMPEGPFYIRAFHHDRTSTADYNFIAHRNLFTSQSEAGVLRANEPVNNTLSGTPINPTDTAWFELQTEKADSGNLQSLRFIVDNFNLAAFQLQVLRDDGTTVVGTDAVVESDPDNPGNLRLLIECTDAALDDQKLYMLVKRTNLSATSYRVRWETNLTVMHGAMAGVLGSASENLYCVEETDTIGDDDIYLTVLVDGIVKVSDLDIGDYDGGTYRTLEDLVGTVRYLDCVAVTLREDGDVPGKDDYLMTSVYGLPANMTQDLNTTSVLECCGGQYLFRYNRSRSLQR
jgi:endonuclease/exonuclease/phosphatase family metal-dependent hydrolase